MISHLRLLAVARKEFIHLLRDWRSLGLALAIPLILILLFGYALDLDLDDVPATVWDQSHSTKSRALLALFEGSPYFSIVRYRDNYRQLEQDINASRAMLAVVIPASFAQDIEAGRSAQLQVIVDGSDANTGRLAIGYVTGISMSYNSKIIAQQLSARGLQTSVTPLSMAPRAWYNTELRSANVLIPGIIAVVMMVIAALLTSVTVAREWELGTMEQLISTPLRGPELVVGKLLPYMLIGFVDVLIAVVMGQWVFGVPLRGSVALLFVIAVVFLVGGLSTGIMFSISLKKQVLSTQLALLATFLPTMLLSGFVFAIYNMPSLIQYLTYIVPARYFIALMRGIYLKGIGLELMWFNALLLIIWAVIVFAAANRSIKLRLD